MTLHRANFAGATFDQCPFAATFGGVTSVAFSPLGDDASFGNGQTLATSDTVLTEHRGIVTAVAFSPDGRTLYSGGADKLINVWDMEAGRCTATWTGHQSWVWSLQYDPASAVLVSAG